MHNLLQWWYSGDIVAVGSDVMIDGDGLRRFGCFSCSVVLLICWLIVMLIPRDSKSSSVRDAEDSNKSNCTLVDRTQ